MIIRHKVLRYIADRPHQVILKQDIMRDCDLAASQVTACVLGIQSTSSIGDEIETLTRGNAWRYTPKASPSQPGRATSSRHDRRRPLTHQLREYFLANPGRVIFLDELVAYTGATEVQVKVGVNNMRNGHRNMRYSVKTEAAGSAWRYLPVEVATQPDPSSTSVPTTATTTTTTTTTPPPPPPDDVDDALVVVDDARSARIFEEVGTIGNAVIIRDVNGVLFRAVRMKE